MWNHARPALALLLVATMALPGYGVSRASRAIALAPMSVPLESLPIQNRSEVTLLSTAHPGFSGNTPITRGIQFGRRGAQVIVDLGGRFTRLTGTIYSDNADVNGGAGPLGFVTVGQPFYTTPSVTQDAPKKFAIDVRGIDTLTIEATYVTGIYDIVADASAGPPLPTTVRVVAPAAGDTFTPGARVRFIWRPFPAAAAYLVHLWVVQAGPAPISAHTPLTLAATVFHATTYTWTSRGYPRGQYTFQVLPVDGRGADLGTWSDPLGIFLKAP